MDQALRVLLVDDEGDYLVPLIKRLTKRGLVATPANSGQEALDILNKNDIDVVVLDVNMPGMNGIATLREIKSGHPLVEVIMLTGHAELTTAREGMELGAFDYLMKPVAVDDLVYKIQDAGKRRIIQIRKIEDMKAI